MRNPILDQQLDGRRLGFGAGLKEPYKESNHTVFGDGVLLHKTYDGENQQMLAFSGMATSYFVV